MSDGSLTLHVKSLGSTVSKTTTKLSSLFNRKDGQIHLCMVGGLCSVLDGITFHCQSFVGVNGKRLLKQIVQGEEGDDDWVRPDLPKDRPPFPPEPAGCPPTPEHPAPHPPDEGLGPEEPLPGRSEEKIGRGKKERAGEEPDLWSRDHWRGATFGERRRTGPWQSSSPEVRPEVTDCESGDRDATTESQGSGWPWKGGAKRDYYSRLDEQPECKSCGQPIGSSCGCYFPKGWRGVRQVYGPVGQRRQKEEKEEKQEEKEKEGEKEEEEERQWGRSRSPTMEIPQALPAVPDQAVQPRA